ncbi:c-type cytochrome [Aestuariivirga sp.]|uniref:c-type cytochrome n=1 Tax=Aestuariivirga sp. TaxID=2650926 RepID=UPI0039E66813
MNSFEFNKIAGAVLGTALLVFGLKALAGIVYHSDIPEKPGFKIDVTEASTGGASGGDKQPAVSLGTLLAAADPKKGEAVSKQCHACHSLDKGGPNLTGPDLWGVVGRKHASHEGFEYSAAMKAHAADAWTYQALFDFLKKPAAAIPGTKMTFGGIPKDTDRANLLAYLKTLSDAPVDFPAP